jgi:hypothetical protein
MTPPPLWERVMMFINPNASPDEIVKSGEEVSASLYGDIIYEDLDILRYGTFTCKVSENPYIAPTSAAASYHSKRAYLEHIGMQFIVLVQYNFKCYYVVIYFNQWFDYK